MQEIEKNNKIEYIIFAIIFVIVICALTFAATYAYFKVSTDEGSTLATVNASVECLDISYGKSNDINLDYQYPITDTYALNNVVPLTITNAYSGSEHDSSFDGITEGLDFAAAFSLVVNVE